MCSIERQSRANTDSTRDSTSGSSIGMVLQRIQEDISMRSFASSAGSSNAYRDERSCTNCVHCLYCFSAMNINLSGLSLSHFSLRPEKTPEQLKAYWARCFSHACVTFQHSDPDVHNKWLFNKTKDLSLLKDPQWEV